jgi:Domain of unknown function (DUF6378)
MKHRRVIPHRPTFTRGSMSDICMRKISECIDGPNKGYCTYCKLTKGHIGDHTNIPQGVTSTAENEIPVLNEAVRKETVCEEANRIVYGDREKTYDHPSRNFDRTVQMWNGYLRAKYEEHAIDLDSHDVAWMMALLKLAREIHTHKRDNVVDAIGYIACVEKMIDFDDARMKRYDSEYAQETFGEISPADAALDETARRYAQPK